MIITMIVARIFNLISLFLFIAILLTWFPNIKWHNEPFKSLRAFSEIFFAPFRKIIPPINGLDFSPVAALIVLSIVSNLIVSILASLKL